MRRVNETLREIVAAEVHELKDPRIGFVTITGVETAPDLRNARVFYSVLGGEEEEADTQAALDHAAPRLQARVAEQVRLKYVPKLHFAVDESIAQGARIDELLRSIEEEHDGPGADRDPEGG
jgi:ribosome-binding factor A